MLYVSTRNNTDLYSAYRALHENQAPDGGYYVPQKIQCLSDDELAALSTMTFAERVARVLNIFFPVGLSGWDVEFTIGRQPYKLIRMNHKLYIAELWHNLKSEFFFLEQSLYTKLREDDKHSQKPSTWAMVAIRIAVLFGIYGELVKSGVTVTDFATATKDYAFITAAVYAQKMGLPIGKIICCSDENENAWDIFHNGEIPCAADAKENQPLFEMLVCELFGNELVAEYLLCSDSKGLFRLTDEQLLIMNQTLDGSVVSKARCSGLAKSIYRTHDYVAEPSVAVAYGGLQDYRSRTGESRTTLLVSKISPKLLEHFVSV